MLFYVLVRLGACLAEPRPRDAHARAATPTVATGEGTQTLVHRGEQRGTHSPRTGRTPSEVLSTPCVAGRGAGLSRGRVPQPGTAHPAAPPALQGLFF